MAFSPCSEAHGGIDLAELRRLSLSPEKLVDFSVNSNPFGPVPAVLAALRKVDITRYPDRACLDLAERLADANKTSRENLLLGNGTAELIWLAARALLQPGDEVLILGPTFGEYRSAVEKSGAIVNEIRAQPPDFIPPVQQILERLARSDQRPPRWLVVCNPNNPTGQTIPDEQAAAIAHACPSGTTLVLDEAYRSFLKGDFFGGRQPGSLVFRSMTKDFAMAGIRLGYVLGEKETIAAIHDFQPPWSVNAFAQAAGLAVLDHLEEYRNDITRLRELAGQFFGQLSTLGWKVAPSDVHYGLVEAGMPANQLRQRLLGQGIQVRDCTSFGLPEYIRISTRLPEENQQLLAALKQIMVE